MLAKAALKDKDALREKALEDPKVQGNTARN